MATPTRIANKTLWALEDIIAATRDARSAWQIVHRQAARYMDPVMLFKLAEVSDTLARIETTARDARQGQYREDSLAGLSGRGSK